MANREFSRRVVAQGLGALAVPSAAAWAGPPAEGQLHVWTEFPSTYAPSRTVWIWTPPGYDGRRRFPVLYMHDGQNLFDASRAAFGEWGVDEALSALVATGRTHGAVVVGIENTTHRRREYLPAPLLEAIAPPVRASILASIEGASESGGYIRFLTDELKPAIDNQFRVRTDRANTFVMGSSMGGLISLEALFQRPDVFGAAACLSTHWPLRFEPFESADAMVAWQEAVLPAITGYIEAGAPRPGRHRILFDHGTLNLDRWYRPYQLAADTAFLRLGYGDRADYRSTVYPGADHNEPSWRARLETPLRFLLGLEEQQ